MWPNITFVDENDNVIGHGQKDEAISKGIIHRIVRIFVLNSKGEILVQKRSPTVDVPNKWDQSAAGHVDEGEDYRTAAQRELQEEVGVSGVELKEISKYYAEETDDSVLKKRFNVLYSALYDGAVIINKEEVSETKWVAPKELEKWMKERPNDFTQGFLVSFKDYMKHA